MAEPLTHDPIEELRGVLDETLQANALRITTSRGGYVGGGQPHATLESDSGATEAVARGLLARKVAEPSRVLDAARAAEPTGETETCPTCWQPVPVPQRGDHDYGIPLSVSPAPEPVAGLRERLRLHRPIIVREPPSDPLRVGVLDCTCGDWAITDDWHAHLDAALLDTDRPGLDEKPDHGLCCECFDAPNFAGGHEHWGNEV